MGRYPAPSRLGVLDDIHEQLANRLEKENTQLFSDRVLVLSRLDFDGDFVLLVKL